MSRIKKIYNLRKTSNIKGNVPVEESRAIDFQQEQELTARGIDSVDKNISMLSQNTKEGYHRIQEQTQDQYLVNGQELVIDRLQLNFIAKLHNIDRKQIKIKNIGNSAIYIQFVFKNNPKINVSGFKDTKLKFYCHYENNVIKPGEQTTFIFSFLSQFPGNFTEQVQINCQPPLQTKIPYLKLSGRAFIDDQWLENRINFIGKTKENILEEEVRQTLSDAADSIKLPSPPKPDVTDLKIAESEFQKRNSHLNLYFNAYLHEWFKQLFIQINKKGSIAEEAIYWDQSVQTLKQLINNAEYLDQVQKKCYSDRLEHYCYLSMTPLPNKSELYHTVLQYVSDAAYRLGGDYIDAARKELDMWEVPFREPLSTDTPEELKARKQQIDKIKAEWVKKAKKKKWGEEEQREMVNQFKKRVQAKTTENILQKFTNFQESAQFIKARQFLKKSPFSLVEYHKFLERMKTVKQYPLEGKKVLLKWHLKLKANCQNKLKQMEQYLAKKKQEEKRLEEEKKNQGGKKKKVAPKPKKKGQKEDEEQKPLFFDFMSILDQENWNAFLETFRTALEKQPFLILIGITYGPKTGRNLPEYSVQFLLEHLRTLESSIQFMAHDQLIHLSNKIEAEEIGQGSIFLCQNLNFLPYQVTQEEEISAEGVVTKRKLLHSEIREFFDHLGLSIDVVVSQDRYLEQLSGTTAYLNKQVILGLQWWRYIGLSMRVVGSRIIFGDDFTAENYILLHRLAGAAKQIYLVGLAGVKFYMAKNKLDKFGNIQISQSEKQVINNLLIELQNKEQGHRFILPSDFIVEHEGKNINYNGSQGDIKDYQIIDIGQQTIQKIKQIKQGHLFVLGQTTVKKNAGVLSDSIVKISKHLFKRQEEKIERHAHQSGMSSGINYNEDLVIYFVGIDETLLQKIDLRDKQIKGVQQGDQNGEVEEQEAQSDKKHIDMVSDFHLSSLHCLYRLWNGKFDIGLRDISKYQIIYDD